MSEIWLNSEPLGGDVRVGESGNQLGNRTGKRDFAGAAAAPEFSRQQRAGALVELALLEHLGFGFDLLQCASTGFDDELIHVSPKSGRAVSASAGEPYSGRLLALPLFLTKQRAGMVTTQEVREGFLPIGHFL